MQPVNNHILIVGAGFSGLAVGIRLKKANIHHFTILERASDVGGTWRDNHYPGAECDIPSPVYSYSFESNPSWSKLFPKQKEILEYLRHCREAYQLNKHIRYNCQVEKARYEESTGLWHLDIQGQDTITGRFFILCSGGLSRPSLPEIKGLQDFRGRLFHSAQWDHSFDFQNSNVAVIGTGASGIQIVPAIASKVSRLKLFQRSAAWILPKPDKVYRPWQRSLARWLPPYRWLQRKILYWQYELRAIALLKPVLMPLAQKRALKFLNNHISDPALRAQLTPQYTMGCKRVLLSNDFYPTLNQEHVELVSSNIKQVTAEGIETADGQHHPCDAIICATGFKVAEQAAPFPILGMEGRDLAEAWQDKAEAYLGTSVSGFPNMFIMVGPNSGLGHNSIIFIIESQAQYILDAVKKICKAGLLAVNLKASVQRKYNADLKRRFTHTVWQTGGCQSWYLTKSGENTTIWPGFSFELKLRTRSFDMMNYEPISQSLATETQTSFLKRSLIEAP